MKICIFGSEEDKNTISAYLSQYPECSFRKMQVDWYSDYDDFICGGSTNEYDAVFVTADNAEGMEGVIAAKKIFNATPVIWLSNDRGFGVQSYRIGTDYFHAKPITATVIEKALQKCMTPNRK